MTTLPEPAPAPSIAAAGGAGRMTRATAFDAQLAGFTPVSYGSSADDAAPAARPRDLASLVAATVRSPSRCLAPARAADARVARRPPTARSGPAAAPRRRAAGQAPLGRVQRRLDAAEHAQPVLALQPGAPGGERGRRDPGRSSPRAAATGIMDQVTAWMVAGGADDLGLGGQGGRGDHPPGPRRRLVSAPVLRAGGARRCAGRPGGVDRAGLGGDPQGPGRAGGGDLRRRPGGDRNERGDRADDHRAGRGGCDRQRLRAADAGRLLQDAGRASGAARGSVGSGPPRWRSWWRSWPRSPGCWCGSS